MHHTTWPNSGNEATCSSTHHWRHRWHRMGAWACPAAWPPRAAQTAGRRRAPPLQASSGRPGMRHGTECTLSAARPGQADECCVPSRRNGQRRGGTKCAWGGTAGARLQLWCPPRRGSARPAHPCWSPSRWQPHPAAHCHSARRCAATGPQGPPRCLQRRQRQQSRGRCRWAWHWPPSWAGDGMNGALGARCSAAGRAGRQGCAARTVDLPNGSRRSCSAWPACDGTQAAPASDREIAGVGLIVPSSATGSCCCVLWAPSLSRTVGWLRPCHFIW